MTQPTRPFIGVPTSTTVAFYFGGAVYMERMSLLHPEGAGVRAPITLPEGTLLPIAFQLSTLAQPIQAKAEVLGDRPTTPAGMALLKTHGESAFEDAMDVGESVTRMIRVQDVTEAKPVASAHGGMCWRFVGLSDEAKKALAQHIQHVQKLQAEQRSGGAGWRKNSDIAKMFDEDSNLSDKAKDW